MSRSEMRELLRLQAKLAAMKKAADMLGESPPQPKPKNPKQVLTEMRAKLRWPSGRNFVSFEEKAREFTQQWLMMIQVHLTDNTNHMNRAIRDAMMLIRPEELRELVWRAAAAGVLKGGNPAKRKHWLHKASWYCVAAAHLITDAAETYDRRLRQREEQRQEHMHISKQTRFHQKHRDQLHATTSVFIPDPTHTLSDDEVFNMDYDSDDDAFPVRVLLDVIDGMVTSKRERTIEWLQQVAANAIKPNPVLGLLRQIPKRTRSLQMSALSKEAKQRQRTLDKVFQRDVVRKVRKWERAVRAGRSDLNANIGTASNTRAGRDSTQRAYQRHAGGRHPCPKGSTHQNNIGDQLCYDRDGQPYKYNDRGLQESRIQEQSPSKTSINTLEDAAAFQSDKGSDHRRTVAPGGMQREPGSNRMHTIDSHAHKQYIRHGNDAQHGAGKFKQTEPSPTYELGGQIGQQTPSPSANMDIPREHIADGSNPIDSADWRSWRQLTPLQRQQYREQRMMQHMKGHTVAMPPEPSSIHMGKMLQQLTGTAEAAPSCPVLESGGSETRALWQNALVQYDYRVWQYRQTHPWYVPTLSKWVKPSVWQGISDELLEPDDQTDGGPANDIAVESFLRYEGRYANQRGERGKVQHSNTLKELQDIKWVALDTHVQSYEAYITKWKEATSTMYTRQIPPQAMQCQAMLDAVRPTDMQERIKINMWAGLGPYELSKDFQPWRLQAAKDVKCSAA